MPDRAFIIQQVGAEGSPERKRADEIYNYIIRPAVTGAGLEPYRADLDLSPGAITPRMLSELLNSRIVIADLTGRNPNVFYELGITHSFVRPLISIADSAKSLPFDAKDERVIVLGEYPPSGLAYAQGERAKSSLAESLKIVLSDGYVPPSPLREAATNRSVDDLAPEDPIAAELAAMRETLEEIHKNVMTPSGQLPPEIRANLRALRTVINRKRPHLDESDFATLSGPEMSSGQNRWTKSLEMEWRRERFREPAEDPWATDTKKPAEDPWAADSSKKVEDPWATDTEADSTKDVPSDEPPF